MYSICGPICSSVFMLGGLLWLVVSAVVYRCDLMCRLIKVHTRGCVGGQIQLAGCVSIGKYVAQRCSTYSPMDTQPTNQI